MQRLTSRSFKHLMPEDVDGEHAFPFYARVHKIEDDTVTFRKLGEDGGEEGVVARSVAMNRLVPAATVNKTNRESLLCRPVAATTAEKVVYGQVVDVGGENVTVESGGMQFVAAVNDVTVVAPAVVLLLQGVSFGRDEWEATEIDLLQEGILDRVLGKGLVEGTTDVRSILDGLLDDQCFPDPNYECEWIDPMSGDRRSFPLQHAVDFAYYVDGKVDEDSDLVGEAFCSVPVQASTPKATGHPQNDRAADSTIFDPYTDDDNDFQELSESTGQPQHLSEKQSSKRMRMGLSTSQYTSDGRSPRRRKVSESSPDVDKDAFIVEKLQHDPVLLNRFLSIREQPNREPSVHDQDRERVKDQSMPHEAKRSETKSKYAFAPTSERQEVHNRLTAERHRGKTPAVYVNSQIRSRSVLCKSLPGGLTRAYDFGFGIEGLSLMHFRIMDRKKRMEWIESGSANFANFSATADFEPAPAATSIVDVVGAARGLAVFAREYYVPAAVELIDEIIAFTEEKVMYMRWEVADVPHLCTG